ncbi:MAG: OsmC family peroxiredoxin, partial [bacterium]|nr:OsmC family peroxiredoxin [bacterium]
KYIFKGTDIPADKVKTAVNLSIDNYCGVIATLKPVVNLTHRIIINDRVVEG